MAALLEFELELSDSLDTLMGVAENSPRIVLSADRLFSQVRSEPGSRRGMDLVHQLDNLPLVFLQKIEELEQRLRHIQEALFNLRFRLASGQVEDPKRVRKYRKAIARIRTIQQERGI